LPSFLIPTARAVAVCVFILIFYLVFLFLVSLAVPRSLGDEIRIPSTDVNKKVKKIFSAHQTIFLYTCGKSAEPHEC
jgi:hypothetical protein